MILRKWSVHIRTEHAADYVRYIEKTGAAHYAGTEGNLAYQILLRDLGEGTSEITTISWWTDIDAIRRFAGQDYTFARYYPEYDQYLIDRPKFVEHHEVIGSNLARMHE